MSYVLNELTRNYHSAVTDISFQVWEVKAQFLLICFKQKQSGDRKSIWGSKAIVEVGVARINKFYPKLNVIFGKCALTHKQTNKQTNEGYQAKSRRVCWFFWINFPKPDDEGMMQFWLNRFYLDFFPFSFYFSFFLLLFFF